MSPQCSKLTGDATDVVFVPDALPALRPGRAARIYRGAVAVGWLGEIHPQIAKSLEFAAGIFV